MTIPVRPANNLLTARSISCSVAGSRREEASSRMTRPGSARKTRVKASNCASPAESPSPSEPSSVSSPIGSERYHAVSPRSSSTARIRSSVIVLSKKVRLSRTVAWNNCTSCVTIPICRRKSCKRASCTGTSPTQIVPACVSYKRSNRRASVVLPLPVCPSTPSTCPACNENDRPCKTASSPV